MLLNEQQQKINRIRNRNVIVSASAGTGKTTVLTDRLIRYLQEGSDIDDFLVVSFTEAAAGELKDRVSLALKNSLADADAEKKRHFRKQLAKIPTADISTIHAFCLDLIKKYGYVLDLDPSVTGRLADDGKLKQFKDRAFRQALDLSRHNELIYRLADRPEDLSDLQKMIERLDLFIENLNDYEKWKRNVLENYALMEKDSFKLYPVSLQEKFSQAVVSLKQSHDTNIGIYRHYLKADSAVLIKAEDLDRLLPALLQEMEECLKEERYDRIGMLISAFKYRKYPALGNNKAEEADKAKARDAKAVYDETMEELAAYYRFNEANRENGKVIRQLLEIAENYRKAYDRLKDEDDVIGYEDMLKKAKEILQAKDGMVARIYRERFKEILVDEYQDTNQNQDDIIRLMAKDNNIFRVGDVKQSIYRFQNAKPELMKSLIRNRGVHDEVEPLQYNYRSQLSILRFSNHVFNRLMNIRAGTYVAKDDDLLPPADKKNDSGEKIRLITVPYETDEKVVGRKGRKEEEKPLRSFNGKQKARYICEYIASEICRRKQEDPSLKWSSFAILVRTNRYKSLLKRELEKHNVPAFTTAKTGFFLDPAVSGVISLLNLIVRDSRLDALNVLSGPLFCVDYETIALNPQLLDTGTDQDHALHKLIRQLREDKKDHSLIELLDRIYNYDDFYMKKISSLQRSNLDSLYKLVLDFQKDSSSIQDLIRYLSTFKTVDREEAGSFTSRDDVVQIMTIHQSKGLQFDHVFLADFHFRPDVSKYSSKLVFSEDSGMAVQYVSLPYKIRHRNPYWDLIRKENQIADFEEELRILYVAVTRAIKGLYIVNACKIDPQKLSLDADELCDKGQMFWIRSALADCPEEISELLEVQTLSEKDLQEHECRATQSSGSTSFDQKYLPHELKETAAEAVSPSQLEERDLTRLDFSAGSGSQRGTLMHKAVELLGIREISMQDLDELPFVLDLEDKKKILAFYEDPLTKSLMENRNEHEYPFISLQDGHFSNGIIDLLSIGEKIRVIDFKSDKNTSETKLKERYAGQLSAYRDIVSRRFRDLPIETLIYSFELGRYVSI